MWIQWPKPPRGASTRPTPLASLSHVFGSNLVVSATVVSPFLMFATSLSKKYWPHICCYLCIKATTCCTTYHSCHPYMCRYAQYLGYCIDLTNNHRLCPSWSLMIPCFTFVYTTIYFANGPTSAVLPLNVGDLIQEYFFIFIKEFPIFLLYQI